MSEVVTLVYYINIKEKQHTEQILYTIFLTPGDSIMEKV